MRRGFILGGHAVITRENGAIEMHWTAGHGRRWSDAASRDYAAMRDLAMEAAATLHFAGMKKVVIDQGVAIAVPGDDPRPGWDLGTVASIDILLAQEQRARAELSDHRPGATDPR